MSMLTKLITVLLIVLSLNATSQTLSLDDSKKGVFRTPFITNELKPYVEEYLRTMLLNKINVDEFFEIDSILLVPMDRIICGSEEMIGCAYGDKVLIKMGYSYIAYGDFYIKVLLYHELGHRVLGLPHSNFEAHIMYPTPNPRYSLYIYNWGRFFKSYVDYYWFCKKNGFLLTY